MVPASPPETTPSRRPFALRTGPPVAKGPISPPSSKPTSVSREGNGSSSPEFRRSAAVLSPDQVGRGPRSTQPRLTRNSSCPSGPIGLPAWPIRARTRALRPSVKDPSVDLLYAGGASSRAAGGRSQAQCPRRGARGLASSACAAQTAHGSERKRSRPATKLRASTPKTRKVERASRRARSRPRAAPSCRPRIRACDQDGAWLAR